MVGVLVACGVVFFVGQRVMSSFNDQLADIEGLESDTANLFTANQLAERKARRLQDYEARALPYNREEARRVYQKWLLDLAIEEVALTGVTVSPGSELLKKLGKEEVYRQFSFTMLGEGTLEQLTRFMYRFHESNLVHRVASMRVTPIKDSKNLKITMRVEALSLPGAPSNKELKEHAGDELQLETLAEYNNVILERNLFGPQNNPPSFRPPGSERGYKGKPISISLRASDKDELDKIASWELTKAPEGAQLRASGESATISWTPRENGEYLFEVAVTDDGIPARTSSGEIKVTITDPPPPKEVVNTRPPDPPKPKFDVAKYTVLSFIGKGTDGRELAWLYQRPTDTMVKRAVGEEFEIGLMTGVITSIKSDYVTFESEDKSYTLDLGDILAEAEPLAVESKTSGP